MSEINYFSKQERSCPCCGQDKMNEAFMTKLNILRYLLGEPMYATSMYRCRKHNAEIGGAPESGHTKGIAADFKRLSDSYTYRVVSLAIMLGFKGIEVGTKHIHLDDIPREKPILFPGISKGGSNVK